MPAVERPRTTHCYRSVEGCDLHVDVIGNAPPSLRPGVVWIHGGGLIFGSRTVSPRPSLVDAFHEQGLVVVSLDHRLAPETKLAGIVDDLRAAWSWLQQTGPQIGIDPRRVALAGASSGGYLALIGGYALEPRPRAIGSLWGFGDITAAWEAEPSEHYRNTLPIATPERAWSSVGSTAVSDAPPDSERDWFYLYCRQQGRWLIEVTDHDPQHDAEWFAPYLPIRNITDGYPPTMLVHGTADNDVPHEESSRLVEQLARCCVPHEFASLDGVGHGFAGASPERISAVEGAFARFIAAHAAAESERRSA